jgi:glycosyltransferase involved in cell wall biosynthesis
MSKQNRIRVLHLLTSLSPGGAETNLLALLKIFDFNRFEHAVGFGGGGVLENEFYDTGAKLIRISESPLNLQSLCSIPHMLKIIKEYDPAIIHSHLDLPNVVGLAAKWSLGCKLILHIHGNAIIPLQKMSGRGLNQWIWAFFNKTYRYCDRAIAICSYQIQYLKKAGLSFEQIIEIPNGITIYPETVPAKFLPGVYKFVNVARFYSYKSQDLLVKAFYCVQKEFPHVHLVLVGDGPTRQDIENLVDRLDLRNNVTFMGVRRDVTQILRECHCFVQSSSWELHPITILEAMHEGLPVVATDVGGTRGTIKNELSGLLVNSGDIDALVSAMLMLAREPDVGVKMGMFGFERVRTKFSNEIVAKNIENEYKHQCNIEINHE